MRPNNYNNFKKPNNILKIKDTRYDANDTKFWFRKVPSGNLKFTI